MEYGYRLINPSYTEAAELWLAKLNVDYDYVDIGYWRLYRIHSDQFNKLPDDRGPYIPVDEDQGFGLMDDQIAESEAEEAGGWIKVAQ
jgi:hypothetical protein